MLLLLPVLLLLTLGTQCYLHPLLLLLLVLVLTQCYRY